MSTHYEVLGLPASKALTPQLVKAAYRRALLQWHPDKNNSGSSTPVSTPAETYSVDQITVAYQILSSPKSKAEYDRELALSAKAQQAAGGRDGEIFRTGVEVVDLEDLDFEEDSKTGETTWYRECRCGDNRGYIIKEADLEEASKEGSEGELYTGCAGCSLWLKVLFGVVEEEEGEVKRNE